jgi:hypothetical protein
MSSPDWWQEAKQGRYAEIEQQMLAATDLGEGRFPINETRAAYYENWGDTLSGEEKIAKYKLALTNWEQWASCSTSGGEGTARMSEVYRVEKKLERLNADR